MVCGKHVTNSQKIISFKNLAHVYISVSFVPKTERKNIYSSMQLCNTHCSIATLVAQKKGIT
jgi:phage-related protein